MKKKHAHLVGIKGVAMAALAVYLSESGMTVTGSDVPEAFPTDEELSKIGAAIYEGFDADRITEISPDVVYYTGAHSGRENPEVLRALELGIPAYPHGKALGMIAADKRQIVVAGSHGKTTTSAMIATLMLHAGMKPSYAIGCGSISGVFAAGHRGASDWMVLEGDEYLTDPGHDTTPRFLWLAPEILVVTNIDFDHPDAYSDLPAVQDAFVRLAGQSKQTVISADDVNSRLLRREEGITSFGLSPSSDYRVTHIGVGAERMFFRLEERGTDVGEFTIRVPGKHNVVNAVSASIAVHLAGVGWDSIREGLLTFTGTKRRFEKIWEKDGVILYDDYAHHPAEIKATLAAARAWYPDGRIIAVFQPHTYSRTKALLSEFGAAFADADTVILTDIYASAREHETLGITGQTLVSETGKHHRDVSYAPELPDVANALTHTVRPGDVIITMGAGSIYTWGSTLKTML